MQIHGFVCFNGQQPVLENLAWASGDFPGLDCPSFNGLPDSDLEQIARDVLDELCSPPADGLQPDHPAN